MKSSNLITVSCITGGLLGVALVIYCFSKSKARTVEVPLSKKDKPKAKKQKAPLGSKPKSPKITPVADPVESTPEIACVKPLVEVPVANVAIEETATNPSAPVRDEFPLRMGSMGTRVERLKVFLMRNYGVFGKINTYLDAQTIAFMQKHLGVCQLDQVTFDRFKMGHHVTEQKIIR